MNALSQKRPKPVIRKAMKTPGQVLAVGIDIAKVTHVARVVRGNGDKLKEALDFTSSVQDMQALVAWVRGLRKRYAARHIFIGMEPTDLYWLLVYTYLAKTLPDCGVYLVSPAAVKHSRMVRSSNLSKHDPGDALVIARLMISADCFRPIQHSELTLRIREAVRLHVRARKAELQARQQVVTMLRRVFPEALVDVSKDALVTVLVLLRDTPLPTDIRSITENQWVTERSSRGRARKRLQALYRKGVHSLGQPVDDTDLWRCAWLFAWDTWDHASTHICRTRTHIETLVQMHPRASAIMTTPGVGFLATAAFFAGVGLISQYKSAAQVEKVFGMDFQRCQSGKTERAPRLTKRGYRTGFSLLYMAAVCATRQEPFATWYRRRRPTKENQSKVKAVMALTAKLFRIMFQIARTGEPFDASRATSTIEHEQTA